MNNIFPSQICNLPVFQGQFDAYQITGNEANTLFASYPAGTRIAPHTHDTDNIGLITQGELILTVLGRTIHVGLGEWYHVPANAEHSAEFNVDTAEIEFWFKK